MRHRTWNRHLAIAVGLIAVISAAQPSRGQQCTGDCDGNGAVVINELVIGVNIALDVLAVSQCAAFDLDADGEVAVNELIGAVNAALDGCLAAPLAIVEPADGLVVPAGTVAVTIALPANVDPGTTRVELDGTSILEQLDGTAEMLTGEVVVAAGAHTLTASVEVDGAAQAVSSLFDAIALDHPEECEILNNVECLLPYPSSRFLVPDSTTATGFRVQIPDIGLPQPNGTPVTAEPFDQLDGFSPTVQILMHFPQGVDLATSDAPRLLPPGCCGQPEGPPWIDTRATNERSLDPDSPSVLLDVDTGERVLHWLEPDGRADGNPARQALIMRPGQSLVPGHRYIVALRNLTAPGGAPVVAETAFAAFRDERPSTIAAIESRRPAMETIFDALVGAAIERDDLVLAFDFVVQSEDQLTRQMLSMRDQAFAWLAQVEANPEERPFTITLTIERDCGLPAAATWRDVRGTFRSPLFLTQSPDLPGAAQLNVDANDVPVQNGFIDVPFSIAIPCSLLPEENPVGYPIVLGHGLFGRGVDMTTAVPQLANRIVPWTGIAGATDFRGLAAPDVGFVVNEVVGVGESQLHNFAALPDRLRQGMLNTLVLTRMMKRGIFNRNTDVFLTPTHRPVFPGPDTEMAYYGISLGGIMGTWLSALTPDIDKFGLDVPGINFSCLLQRSTQFSTYDQLLLGIGITDPLDALLGLGVLHELWVSGEPAGYARHITSDPLPGSGEAKRILMTPAWLDKQVSNQCTEIAARTLELPNLAPGSLQRGLPGIPDLAGPLDSAYVMYDTGSFDLFNPAHEPFIPPLSNVIPSSVCDPHSARPTIPASIRQLAAFLEPGGQIENFCTGDCDAGEPAEIPSGASAGCDPLNP